jgi:hypothetical protein
MTHSILPTLQNPKTNHLLSLSALTNQPKKGKLSPLKRKLTKKSNYLLLTAIPSLHQTNTFAPQLSKGSLNSKTWLETTSPIPKMNQIHPPCPHISHSIQTQTLRLRRRVKPCPHPPNVNPLMELSRLCSACGNLFL